jgi:hypothetical protein
MLAQGFPSSEKRKSGSNVKRFPTVKLKIAAGFPNVNVGINEMPLFVMAIEAANFKGFWEELSLLWANNMLVESIKEIIKREIPLTLVDDNIQFFNFCKFK